jgi:hypothetical protein
MRDTLLPVALLGASLGLSTGLAPAGTIRICVLTLAAMAVTVGCVRGEVTDHILVPAWIAVALGAGTSWLPVHRRRHAMMLGLGCLSGGLAGTLPTASAGMSITVFASALTLAAAASAILFARGWILPARVVASWLVAIAALNVTLTLLPVTPGYLPDHLE